MPERSPRLHFTEEELQDPVIRKAAEKAEKQADRLEKAESKIPQKTVLKRQRTIDPQTGRVTTKLRFEEVDRKPPSSKLAGSALRAPVRAAAGQVHREAEESDNVGVETADSGAKTAEHGVHAVQSGIHSRRMKPYRTAARREKSADRANIHAMEKQFQQETGFSENPYTRWRQKRSIKRKYADAKRAKEAERTAGSAARAAEKTTERTAGAIRRIASFLANHKVILGVLTITAVTVVIVGGAFSSCSVLTESGISAIMITTYPSTDEDMMAAEAEYSAMEAELQSYLNNYAASHDYDEYVFDLDEIGHDPYVLISLLTAYFEGPWTIGEAENLLSTIFEMQYILTESVQVVEVESEEETETKTICTVTLENFNLSHIPVYLLTEDQLSLYSIYMATLGNRPDLFPNSAYVGMYDGSYSTYEIPGEALADEQFAAMIREAEKYLGYPYVWGGSSPSTSFDCSGFVCWVINNCGVGWNVGRLTAQGLLNICTVVSPSEARPGDLIFFQNTYATSGASHVGIYVGNGMMIHCGDPIQYADITSSYWQSHFLAYGRLPSP